MNSSAALSLLICVVTVGCASPSTATTYASQEAASTTPEDIARNCPQEQVARINAWLQIPYQPPVGDSEIQWMQCVYNEIDHIRDAFHFHDYRCSPETTGVDDSYLFLRVVSLFESTLLGPEQHSYDQMDAMIYAFASYCEIREQDSVLYTRLAETIRSSSTLHTDRIAYHRNNTLAWLHNVCGY